jgi:hypothetical protein
LRLSESKIKEAILHHDQDVRAMAVQYFADCFSQEKTVMPLFIQSVEKYGWQNAVSCFALRKGLAQTDDTLLWVLGELSKVEDIDDEGWQKYTLVLIDLLTQTDAHLLSKHQSAILNIEGLDLKVRESVLERIRLLNADPDTCWAELQEFCEQNKSKQYINEVNLPHANRLVEAIARSGERYTERVLSILTEQVEDYANNPMMWMESLTVRLAGEMRLEAAVPLIVKKLHEDDDLLHEEGERALWKIGTNDVVETVCADYAQADWSYRLFANSVLECIHSDLTVRKCLEFLPKEEDTDLRVWLGQALLRQFSFEGIEPLRQVIIKGPLDDPEMLGLRKDLLTTCKLMEVTIPEFDQWTEESKHDEEQRKNYYAEKFGKLGGGRDEDDFEPLEDDYEEPPLSSKKQKIGRNDPCPCGSGRKFKKCCLKKQNSNAWDE